MGISILQFIGFELLLGAFLFYTAKKLLKKEPSFSIQNNVNRLFQAIKEENRLHLYAFCAVALIGILVRVFYLSRPMCSDEAYTCINFVLKPLYAGLSDYPEPNNHLFNTFLSHIAYLLLGNRPWVVRLPAFFAGIAMIPASYALIRIFYNKHAALLTAGLTTSSLPLIGYSTQTRGYTLVCLFFLLLFALATQIIQLYNAKNTLLSKNQAWLIFVILASLGFYSIPTMLYPLGIITVWLILSVRKEKKQFFKDLFFALAMTGIITVMLYMPVLIISGIGSVIGNKYVSVRSWQHLTSHFPLFLHVTWRQWNLALPRLAAIVAITGFIASQVFHKRLTRHRVSIILAVFISCFPLLIIQKTVGYARTWLFLLPVFIGLGSSGIVYLLSYVFFTLKIKHYKKIIFSMTPVILSFLLALHVVNTGLLPYHIGTPALVDAQAITLLLKKRLKKGDKVLVNVWPSGPVLEYFFSVYKVPRTYLRKDFKNSKRIFTVLDKLKEEERSHVNRQGKTRVLMRYKFSTVYQTSKKWKKNKKIKYARYSPPFSDSFLEGIKGNNPVKFLIKAMKNKNFRVRENAAWILGEIKDSSAVPCLIEAVKDRRWSVRLKAVWALGKIRDNRAVRVLCGALSDENRWVRKKAAHVLGRLKNPYAIHSLIKTFSDVYEDGEIRNDAVWALGKIEDPGVIEPLISVLQSRRGRLGEFAAMALGKIGDVRAVNPLITALRDMKNSWEKRSGAAHALGNIKDRRSVNALIDALGDKGEGWIKCRRTVRKNAAWALGNIGDDRAVKPLTLILDDECEDVSKTAELALKKMW